MRIFANTKLLNLQKQIAIITILAATALLTLSAGCGSEDEGIARQDGSPATKTATTKYADCLAMSHQEVENRKQDYAARIDRINKEKSTPQDPVVEIFLRQADTDDEMAAFGEQLKAMPEVKSVAFISREEAMNRMRESLKGHEDVLNGLQGNPLPASYQVTLNDPATMEAFASRFYNDPLVDNSSPTDHDGVKVDSKPTGMWADVQERAMQDWQDFIDNAHSCEDRPV